MSKHFDGDLLEGKAAEDSFARLLTAGRELWEHKRDRKCTRTGNVALEYETSSLAGGQGDRWESGIQVCKAHWFVIEYADERRLVLGIEDVKDLARAAIRDGRHKWIGDNARFHNALVPLQWFLALPVGTNREIRATELDRIVESWTDILPTDGQAREYAQTGSFTPDAAGWAV